MARSSAQKVLPFIVPKVHPAQFKKGTNGTRWLGHVKMTKEQARVRGLENSRNRYKRHPELFIKYGLAKYGITIEQYEEMNRKQRGLCAICGKPPLIGKRAMGKEKQPPRLCVDHDHLTGKVRGLLCHWCNSHIVAGLEKSGATLRRVAEYLGMEIT